MLTAKQGVRASLVKTVIKRGQAQVAFVLCRGVVVKVEQDIQRTGNGGTAAGVVKEGRQRQARCILTVRQIDREAPDCRIFRFLRIYSLNPMLRLGEAASTDWHVRARW